MAKYDLPANIRGSTEWRTADYSAWAFDRHLTKTGSPLGFYPYAKTEDEAYIIANHHTFIALTGSRPSYAWSALEEVSQEPGTSPYQLYQAIRAMGNTDVRPGLLNRVYEDSLNYAKPGAHGPFAEPKPDATVLETRGPLNALEYRSAFTDILQAKDGDAERRALNGNNPNDPETRESKWDKEITEERIKLIEASYGVSYKEDKSVPLKVLGLLGGASYSLGNSLLKSGHVAWKGTSNALALMGQSDPAKTSKLEFGSVSTYDPDSDFERYMTLASLKKQRISQNNQFDSAVGRVVGVLIEQAPRMVVSLAAAYVTGGTSLAGQITAGSVASTLITFGETYSGIHESYKAKGEDGRLQAAAAAFLVSGIEYSLGGAGKYIGLGTKKGLMGAGSVSLFKRSSQGLVQVNKPSLLREILKTSIEEGIEEFSQTWVEMIFDADEQTFEEYMNNMLYSGMVGVVAGAVYGGGIKAFQSYGTAADIRGREQKIVEKFQKMDGKVEQATSDLMTEKHESGVFTYTVPMEDVLEAMAVADTVNSAARLEGTELGPNALVIQTEDADGKPTVEVVVYTAGVEGSDAARQRVLDSLKPEDKPYPSAIEAIAGEADRAFVLMGDDRVRIVDRYNDEMEDQTAVVFDDKGTPTFTKGNPGIVFDNFDTFRDKITLRVKGKVSEAEIRKAYAEYIAQKLDGHRNTVLNTKFRGARETKTTEGLINSTRAHIEKRGESQKRKVGGSLAKIVARAQEGRASTDYRATPGRVANEIVKNMRKRVQLFAEKRAKGFVSNKALEGLTEKAAQQIRTLVQAVYDGQDLSTVTTSAIEATYVLNENSFVNSIEERAKARAKSNSRGSIRASLQKTVSEGRVTHTNDVLKVVQKTAEVRRVRFKDIKEDVHSILLTHEMSNEDVTAAIEDLVVEKMRENEYQKLIKFFNKYSLLKNNVKQGVSFNGINDPFRGLLSGLFTSIMGGKPVLGILPDSMKSPEAAVELLAKRAGIDTDSMTTEEAAILESLGELVVEINGIKPKEFANATTDTMTYEQLANINTAVKNLMQMNNAVNRLRAAQENAELTEATQAMAKELATVEEKEGKRKTSIGEEVESLVDLAAGMFNDDAFVMLDRFSGGVTGQFSKWIGTKITEGRDLEAATREIFRNYLLNKLDELGVGNGELEELTDLKPGLRKTAKRHDVAVGDSTINITGAELISLYLTIRNVGNLSAMLKKGFATTDNRTVKHFFPDDPDQQVEQLWAIVEKVKSDPLLDKGAKLVYDFFNEMHKKIVGQTSLKFAGFDVATIKHYFPIYNAVWLADAQMVDVGISDLIRHHSYSDRMMRGDPDSGIEPLDIEGLDGYDITAEVLERNLTAARGLNYDKQAAREGTKVDEMRYRLEPDEFEKWYAKWEQRQEAREEKKEARRDKQKEEAMPIVLYDAFGILNAEMQSAAFITGMQDAVGFAKKIFSKKSKVYQELLRKGYGKEVKVITQIFQEISGKVYGSDPIDKTFLRVSQRTTAYLLSTPHIAAAQFFSYFMYGTRTNTSVWLKALAMGPVTKAEIANLEERSSWFRERHRSSGGAFTVSKEAQTSAISRMLGGRRSFREAAFSAIHWVDIRTVALGGRIVDIEMATSDLSGEAGEWYAMMYGKQPSQMTAPERERAFKQRFHYLAVRTQPNHNIEDRSINQLGTGFKRVYAVFRSFINKPLSEYSLSYIALRNGKISKARYARKMSFAMLSLSVASVMKGLVRRWGYGQDYEFTNIAIDALTAPVSPFFLFGRPLEIAINSAIKTVVSGKTQRRDLGTGTIIDTVIRLFGSTVVTGSKILSDAMSPDREVDRDDLIKYAKGIVELSAMLGGVPFVKTAFDFKYFSKDDE